SAAGLVAFFKSSAEAALEEEAALNRLAFAVDATGGSFGKVKDDVLAFAQQQQGLTRFSDTQTFEAMGKLVRVTGDVGQAMQATRLVFGLASQSGKDFNTVMDLLAPVLQGDASRVRALKNEFGAFIGEADTAQEVVDALSQKFLGAAESEQGFGVELAKTRNILDDFKEQVGTGVLIIVNGLLKGVNFLTTGFEQLATVAAGAFLILVEGFEAVAKAAADVFAGNFKDAAGQVEEFKAAFVRTVQDTADQVDEIEARSTKKRIDLSNEEKAIKVGNSKDAQKEIDKEKAERERASAELKDKLSETEAGIKDLKGLNTEAELQRIEIEKEAKLRAVQEIFDKSAKTQQDEINLILAKAAITEEAETKSRLLRESNLKAIQETTEQVQKAIAGASAKAVADMILEGKSFEKAYKEILNTVLRVAIETFVRIKIEAAIAKTASESAGGGGGLGALGAVAVFATVGKNLFKKYQHGGIVTEPTLGLIGEAGPEAVIPLNKAGSLGGNIQVTVQQTNHFTVNGAGDDEVRVLMRRISEVTRNGAMEGAELVKSILSQAQSGRLGVESV
ncbi:MAG: hypothetical protein HY548_02170, partial [Elusimicrobia bacterium]|nr:hypothetical protein [Elusimicrobiota bacterium]